MIIIYSSLSLGGIETFFLRLARERAKNGLKTTFLLEYPATRSNPDFITEAKASADVIYLETLSNSALIPYSPTLALIQKYSKNELLKLFTNHTTIHVADGFSAQLAFVLMNRAGIHLPVTIGFYHSREFCWGSPPLPFFETENRNLVLKRISKKNIVMFNDNLPDFYNQITQTSFDLVKPFPLGVSNSNSKPITKKQKSPYLKICSVGRLVDFKTYNLWMPDVIKFLIDAGIPVIYDIYGTGPLQNTIERKAVDLGLENAIRLKGNLSYDLFDDTVSQYDLFVGSGTAIIQAASLGVPSIVGIEQESKPQTYGFLSNIPGTAYNENNLYKKFPVLELIRKYSEMSAEQIDDLRLAHKNKAQEFSMETCLRNFLLLEKQSEIVAHQTSLLWKFKYTCNYVTYLLKSRFGFGQFYQRYKCENNDNAFSKT